MWEGGVILDVVGGMWWKRRYGLWEGVYCSRFVRLDCEF